MAKKPNRSEQIAIETVNEAFELSSQARTPYDRKWNEYYRLSEGIVPSQRAKWMTNRFVPYTPALIDLILPRMAARRPSAQVTGWDEDSGLKQQKFNELLTYQQDCMHIDAIFSDWIYDTIRYGTGFLKMGWKKETGKDIPHSAGFLNKMKGYFKSLGFDFKNDNLLYDGPTVEHVDIFDLFAHPKATSIESSPFIIHRMELNKWQINQNTTYRNINFEDLSTGNSEIDKFRRQRLVAEGLPTNQINKMIGKMSAQYYEVLEYWGEFDIDGDGQEEQCKIVVINREKILAFEENPYYHGQKPFVHLRYQTKPKFFYGRGIVERVRDLQYELNDIGNQSSDMRKLSLFPIIKISKSAGIDIENLKIQPGLPIPLENPETDLIFERPPDFTQQLEFMAKATREAMQIATGATDVILGQQDVGLAADTFGGAQLAQEQSTLRFLIPLMNLDSGIEKFGDFLISLNQQYFDRKKEIRIYGTDGIKYQSIAPKDITGHFNFRVTTQSMVPQSKSMEQQKYVNLKNLFMNDPSVDQKKLDDFILRAFDVDPVEVRAASALDSPELQKFKSMNPQQQQAYIKTLPPQDQEIMMKAIGSSLPVQDPGTPVTTPGANSVQTGQPQ